MMGASASAEIPRAVVVSPASGDNGAVRRHSEYPELMTTSYPEAGTGVFTVYDAFRRGLRVSKDKPCFGHRPILGTREVPGKDGKPATKENIVGDFQWKTYAEIAEIIENLASGLIHFNAVGANDIGHRLVGIFSKNRWEWVAAQHAAFYMGSATVPLYDTLGAEAAAYIVQQTGVTVMVCSRLETPKLIAYKTSQGAAFASLVNVVQMEDIAAGEREAAAAVGFTLRSFAEVMEAGRAHKAPPTPPAPTDMALLCYTSGTTGSPKGGILTHRMLVADASGAQLAHFNISGEDVLLSYLPLAHCFEQVVEVILLMVGGSIGFFQGDSLKILEDIKALRPTIFPSVPRLFNRIYDRIVGNAAEAGGVKTWLFNTAIDAKKYWLKQNVLTHSIWDPLVFNPIKVRVGLDRMRIAVSGSAPLAPHVLEFLRCVFGVTFVEGYGQTECCAAATVQPVNGMATIGHVGPPLPNVHIRLASVPDLGYRVTDTVHGREVDKDGNVTSVGIPCEGRGEICFKGPIVFPGYYKDAEKTAEAIDGEGWLHSGDIGIWTPEGNLKIVDRKKNMFKLSQGEYIAVEKVENSLLSNWIQQIYVYGDSFRSQVIAVIVPNPDQLAKYAKENGLTAATTAELCANPKVKKEVMDSLIARAKETKLLGFEIPKAIHLESEPWTPENILTPTFKVKRADAKKLYATQIDALYSTLESVAGVTNIKQK